MYGRATGGGTGGGESDIPYIIDGYITEIDTEKIDSNYMNSRFEKYLKALNQSEISEEELDKILSELHKSFASLTQEEQKYANIFVHDIQRGQINIEEGKSFREYITEYQYYNKNKQIENIAEILGLDLSKLKNLMSLKVTEKNINEFGRFDELLSTVDKSKAKKFFEVKENKEISDFEVNLKLYAYLRKFILTEGANM